MKKLISPSTSHILNYLFAGLLMTGPKLLKMKGLARSLSYKLGSSMIASNLLSRNAQDGEEHTPIQAHKQDNKGQLGTLLLVPLAVSVMNRRRARYFFFGMLAAGVATALLTHRKQAEQMSQ
jgi:hypothetical protein